jgi:hypothetical protein
MELPRLASGVHRVAVGGNSATAGMRPAFRISIGGYTVSCHCTEPAPGYNSSCLCRWWGGGCYGGAQVYEDGSWETWSGCSAKP